MIEGRIVGVVEDTRDGCAVLITEGMTVGRSEGARVGTIEGATVGHEDGEVVGLSVGRALGEELAIHLLPDRRYPTTHEVQVVLDPLHVRHGDWHGRQVMSAVVVQTAAS